jgi:hypothetical protein
MARPRFEKLPGLPPYGPLARAFGGPQHSEGLVVRFWTATGETWVGNFHRGYGRASGLVDHPDKQRVVVVARGQGYVVNPDVPEDVVMFGHAFHEFFSLPQFGAILFVDDLGMETINKEGRWWCIPRIAWDGICNIKIEGDMLYGEAFTPFEEKWVPFTVKLEDGKCEGSVYEADMARAVMVRR